MKKPVALLLAIALLSGCDSAKNSRTLQSHFAMFTAASSQPTVSALREGERLVVRFVSEGCFHHESLRFEFYGPAPISVKISGGDASQMKGANYPRELTLDRVSALKLDRALAFYRQETQGYCTTTDKISLHWFRKDGEIQESYVDGTCDVDSLIFALPFSKLATLSETPQ